MYTLGIDIGGTKVKLGLFENNQMILVNEIRTPKKRIIEAIVQEIERISDGKELMGIGIASAGIVDSEAGIVTRASHLPHLQGKPLKKMIEERFRVPTVIANDANCATLAEGVIGSAKGLKNYICLTIGTGIGGGLVQNNSIVYGRNGYGGEVGHMTLVPNGLPCVCGREGCFQMYASGKAIERMIQENNNLLKIGLTPKDAFETYDTNDDSKGIVDQYLDYLSTGLVNLQYVMDPELIVLGGGVIDSSHLWWDKLIALASRKTRIPLKIKQARLKNNAGVIGANFLIEK